MSDRMKNLLEAALSLSAEERAEIASKLLDTLDGDENIDRERIDQSWVVEAERRFQAYKRGEIQAVDAQQVLDDLFQGSTNEGTNRKRREE